MKRLLMALILILLAGAFSVPAHGAAIPPLEGLELARRGFAGLKDFVADITQEKQISILKKKLVSTGTVRFRRPDSFYMEIDPPHASKMLLRDNVLTMVFPADNVRQQTVLPPDEGLLRWFTMLDKPVTKLPEGMDLRAERTGEGLLLVLKPKGKRGVKELQILLQTDGRPKRLVIEEQNRDRTVMTFRNVKKNVGLSEKDLRLE